MRPYSFELVSRSCLSPEAYLLKTLYIGLGLAAISACLIVLGRIAVKRWRQKPTTSIGRLVEYLVVVQGR